tara:strand:- start:526 stop:780 length:255 start_codon:yes stop_codon:yes gene_type:complete
MPICNNNKYKNIVREYRCLVGEQAELIKQQADTIHKLENELKSLTEACKNNSQFEEYFQFYLKDRKKYNIIINEVDRILTKFNC